MSYQVFDPTGIMRRTTYSGTKASDITTGGFYYLTAAVTDVPTSGRGILLHLQWSLAERFQWLMDTGANSMLTRRFTSGSWTDWAKFTPTS